MHRTAAMLRHAGPQAAPPLTARRRLQLLSYAVSIRPEHFSNPIAISTTVHALERLHLEPPADEVRRWNHLLRAVDLSVDQLDDRSTCNVLHSLSTMLARVFKPRQDLILPSMAQGVLMDRLQAKLYIGVASLMTAQTLICVESLLLLKRLNLAHGALLAVLCDRTPALADQVVRSKDFDTLVRIVSSTEQEWQNADVVADIMRNVHRAVSTHQDAIRVVDALTRRKLENGSIVMCPVPPPLQPLLEHLYAVALRQIVQMPPSQLSAWYSRIFDEWSSRHSEEFWSRTLSTAIVAHADPTQHPLEPEPLGASGRQLLAALTAKLQRASTLEGLSDTALRTIALVTCRMWTLPKQESDTMDADDTPQRQNKSIDTDSHGGVGGGGPEAARRAFYVRREAAIGATYLDGAGFLSAILAEMRSRTVREPRQLLDGFLDAVVAIPHGMLQDDQEGRPNPVNDGPKGLRKAVLALLRGHVVVDDPQVCRARVGAIASPRTQVALTLFVVHLGLAMIVHSPAGRGGQRPTSAVANEGSGLVCSMLAATTVDRLTLNDVISLVNELCTLVYTLGNPQRDDNRRVQAMSSALDAVRSFCTSLHSNNVLASLRSERRRGASRAGSGANAMAASASPGMLAAVSTGQLVRYASSISKLGVRKKVEYMPFVLQLGRRALTGFEVVRLCHVLARHGIHAPYLQEAIGERIVNLRTSLKPKQKVLLLKALGQLHYDWPSIAAASVSASGDYSASVSSSPMVNSAVGSTLRRQVVVAGDGDEWFVPRAVGERQSSPRSIASAHRHGPSLMEQRSLIWFLFDVVPTTLDTLSAVHLLIAWAKLHVNAVLAGTRLRADRPWWSQGAASGAAPSGGATGASVWMGPLVLQVLGMLEANPQMVHRIASCAKVADLMVALALFRLTPPTAQQQFFVSDTVLSVVAHHLAVLAHETRNPFLDFNAASVWWSSIGQAFQRTTTSDDGQPSRNSGGITANHLEALRTLHAAIRQKLLQRLQSIANSPTLSPNTFIYAQLRMALVFQLEPVQPAQQASQEVHPAPGAQARLDWTQWARLVAALPVDEQLVRNALKKPVQLADTQSLVDVATILSHHHCLLAIGSGGSSQPSSQLGAFAHEILPPVWRSGVLQLWEKEEIMGQVQRCIREWVAPSKGA